jgi:hydrogenase maturation protease
MDRLGSVQPFRYPPWNPASPPGGTTRPEPVDSLENASGAAPPGGRAAVLGLGNPILSDDGVGLAVAGVFARLLAESPLPGVDVLCSARAGFELIDLLRDYARAVIVDCLVLPEPQPGRVRRLSLDDVTGSPRLINMHEVSIDVAFRVATRLGIPMPRDVVIFAVEAADTATIAEGLTPEVAAAVQPLARAIHENLRAALPTTPAPDTEEFRRRRAAYAPGGLG